MNKSVVILVAFIAGCTLCFGRQQPTFEQYQQKFPGESAVYIECAEAVTILMEGDSLRAFADVREELLLMKEQVEGLSDRKIYGSSFSEITDIKAKTLVWNKNRYSEMAVSDFKKTSDHAQGIFYDDSYYYSFNFPAVSMRSKTKLQYRELIKDARFLHGYVFSRFFPQAKATFTIKTSPGVEIAYQVFHDEKNSVRFSKTEKGGFVYYEWSYENVPRADNDQGSPSLRYYAPHVIFHVKSFKDKKGNVKKVLNSVDDLYSWYYSFVRNLNKTTSPALVKIVEDIKASSTSELDLVRRVFYWVQSNIQYVAFEQGMRGLIPHPGAYVCEKRYGDCKDMANLIVAMLSMADVKAYHTWIGTRDLPYTYSQIPSPIVDNHMIATYKSDKGEYYFLDATSDTPFGLPSSMIQGKEALIGYDESRWELRKVPEMPGKINFVVDSIQLSIQNNGLSGKGSSSFHGYEKVFGRYELNRSRKEDVEKSVTRMIGKGSNKFFLDQYQINHLDDFDQPTRIDYSFRIEDYYQQIGDEIYINLNLSKDHYNSFIDDGRKTPKENEYQYEKYEFIDFTIPSGYTVEYLPQNAKGSNPLMGYDIAYSVQADKIKFSKRYYLNYLLLLPGDFEQWNNAVKEVSKSYKESIILKKK